MPPETTEEEQETTEEAAAEGDDQTDETTEEGQENEEEEQEETPAPTPDQLDKIVSGLAERLGTAPKGPSADELRVKEREAIKAQTGMTDAQIDYMDSKIANVVAPIYAQTVYDKWKTSKGEMLTPEIEKDLNSYLEKYPHGQRADPVLLDNIFYMEIGKRAASQPKPANKTKQTQQPTGDTVIGRKIVPQTPGSATGLSGESSRGSSVTLTPEEKLMARKMRMSEADYALAKTSAVVSELKKK